MADLVDKNSALVVKVTGADSSGNETNFIDATVNGVKVDGSAVTQPVSASSLPLPSGAATSANQTTANSSLSSIDGKTPSLGQAVMVSSSPVVIASNQTAIPVSGAVTANAGTNLNTSALSLETTQTAQSTLYGAVTEIAPATDTASSGLNGRLQRIAQRLTSIFTAFSDGTQRSRITDGTNNAAVKNTAASGADFGIVVRPVTVELPTFSIIGADVIIGSNKSMLAIQNTGTSIVRIREIWIINDQTAPVTGVVGLIEVRRIVSYTGGTNILPESFDSTDSLPAGITSATGSTVATETSLLRSGKWSTDEWGPGTTDVESLDHAIQQSEPFWKQTPNGKALTIRQNQGIHVKFATNSTAGSFNIRIIFTAE